LTVSLRCGGCGRPAPAVGFDRPATCGCGNTTQVPGELWTEILERADMSSFEATAGLEDSFELQASTGAAAVVIHVGEPVCDCGAALQLPESGSNEGVACRSGEHQYLSLPVPIVLRESVPTALQITRPEPPTRPRFWITFQGTPRAIRDQRRAALEAVIKERAAPLSVRSPEGPVSLQMSSYQIAKQAAPKRKERAPPWLLMLVVLTAGAGLAWYAAGEMKKKSRGASVEQSI
jgi:hypothetical protein